jgi:MarR family transcriptional regulator, transcriptional regulator for hemolysin
MLHCRRNVDKIVSVLILSLRDISMRSFKRCLEAVVLPLSTNREFAFMLNDVARMLRTYADYKAAQFGITRAQWVVLSRLDRSEGLKQSELAEVLDLQPISLTRLLDKLCESGLIERRADPVDRRAKRLFLTAAARPLLEKLGNLGEELMGTALCGVERERVEQMIKELGVVKENLRQAIQQRAAGNAEGERRYG